MILLLLFLYVDCIYMYVVVILGSCFLGFIDFILFFPQTVERSLQTVVSFRCSFALPYLVGFYYTPFLSSVIFVFL